MTSETVFDITIIGGGPSGLYAAFYAGLRATSTKIIDSMPQLGGQLAALYPDKYIYDIPGFPKVLASELVERQVEQAMQFGPTICLDEKVVELGHGEDGLITLGTERGNHHLTRTTIIAAGVGAFVPRTLDLPDLKEMEGRGVYYFVTDLEAFRGKRVLVIEDGPTLTHGGMAYGAGVVAARRFGAAELVDPRPYAVRSIAATFVKYPDTGPLLPAMGYGDEQVHDLEETINATDCDLVLSATPIDLRRVLNVRLPMDRVRYELQVLGQPTLEEILKQRLG